MSKKNSHIDISERKLLLRVIDVVVLIFSLWLANRFLGANYFVFNNQRIVVWIITLMVYYLFLATIFEAYDLKVSNNRFLTTRSIVLTTLLTTLIYVFTPILTPSLPSNRLQLVYFFLYITIPVLLWRIIYMSILFTPKYFKYLVVIGHYNDTKKVLNLIKNTGHHDIMEYISNKKIEDQEYPYKNIADFSLDELSENDNISEVLVSLDGFSPSEKISLQKQIVQLFEEGINIKSFEQYYEEVNERIPREYLNHEFYKKINYSKNNSSNLYLFFHRLLDIVSSIIGLTFFTFIVPIVFLGNLIANRGALLYTQNRVGKRGEVFKIYKFRTMVSNAEKDGAVWAQKNDARITPFGKFLRNTRLDEIPQFFNVLKGEMSLIGPRPERPEFVEKLEKQIPFYAIRHAVRPGLTGWAQVNYSYASSIEDQEIKLRYDLYYIKERGVFIDFKILMKTINTVLFFKGQ